LSSSPCELILFSFSANDQRTFKPANFEKNANHFLPCTDRQPVVIAETVIAETET
jgi:hypothetical protein